MKSNRRPWTFYVLALVHLLRAVSARANVYRTGPVISGAVRFTQLAASEPVVYVVRRGFQPHEGGRCARCIRAVVFPAGNSGDGADDPDFGHRRVWVPPPVSRVVDAVLHLDRKPDHSRTGVVDRYSGHSFSAYRQAGT